MLKTLLILIFMRPFISSMAFPYANFTYSVLLLGFIFIWIIIGKKIPPDTIRPIKYPLILFILALSISLAFSQNRMISIKESYKYISGVLLFMVGISLSHKNRERLILYIVIAALIISLLAIYQYFFGFKHILDYIVKTKITDSFALDYIRRKRVFFPFVTPNALGGYLAMILPLSLINKHRIWFIMLLSLVLLLTKSLGALLSIFFALGMYFYLQDRLEKRRILLLFGLLVIIGLVFIARTTNQKQHIQPIFSATMRLDYWKDTLEIIKTKPLAGVGIGNFNLPQCRYTHNSYLQIWAEMGILGIISILWLIIAVLKSAIKNIKSSPHKEQIAGLITACVVFLIHNLIDFSFFLPEVSVIWWVILGLILSKNGGVSGKNGDENMDVSIFH